MAIQSVSRSLWFIGLLLAATEISYLYFKRKEEFDKESRETAAVYFLSFKEAAANKKLLDHNLKEKRVQRLPLRVSLFYIKIGKQLFF